MNWGRKRINVNNWRHLTVLALLAALFLGVAYWLSARDQGGVPQKTEAAVSAAVKQPLPNTPRGQQVRELLSDDSYQIDLPDGPKPVRRKEASAMPLWLVKVFFYGLVALGIFTLAVFVWVLVTGNTRIRPPRTQEAARKTRQAPPPADHELARHGSLADAPALAAEGAYGEAVRALLAAALVSLAKRDMLRLRPSMTGREIVGHAALVQDGKEALAYLVMTVEAYAFAGDKVARETYETCLRHHDFLVQKQRAV